MTTAEVSVAIDKKPTVIRKFLERHKIERLKGPLGSGAAKQIDALSLVHALRKDGRLKEAETLMEWLERHDRIART